ncbi:MAG: CCA tRNA nucleotidyltransferase [Actinomycetota bacterium]|jgi:poly(A) polymerase|nr:CCA tRNA nucleotidyltransferase [Actinomycetota bacterium]
MSDLPSVQRQLARLLASYPVADELGRRFADAGHELYLVGGTVRDAFLDRAHDDLDFATSAAPSQTKRLMQDWADAVWLPGERFGTISAARNGWKLEITTFRADRYSAGSRHPDVRFAGDITADLSRRDFTCNAMAVRLSDHRFVDPFGGLADLRSRVLRTPLAPEDSFSDDPLRLVRLARFAAVLDAEPDDATRKAATAMAGHLDEISRERIRAELDKLICAPHQARGMDLLCDTGLADRFLPEVGALRMQHDPVHHHKDVYTHTLAVVDGCPTDDVILRLAALLHDIGKPATREFHPDGKVTFHHHEVVGKRLADKRLRALRYPNDVIADVGELIYLHLRFHGYAEDAWTDAAVRRYVRDAGRPEQLLRLNRLTRADVTTRNRAKARRLQRAMDDLEARIARLQAEEELARIRPQLDGRQIMRHLGLPPGPDIGKARQMLLEARLDSGPMTDQQAYDLLDAWARERDLGEW